ncbi:clavesin-1-like isoform X1 [Onthophagus taurus]|uniref:clavesin-1-like isoform X1 n=1 Tax=Onthophagus taurus TaxID=166361 RepID=UPI0039BE92C1
MTSSSEMEKKKIIDFEGKELNSDDIKQRIEELRQLILADENYRLLRTDDAFLLRFLHRLNFNVQKAFKGIKYYYNYVVEEYEWLPLDPIENYKKHLDMNMRFILPHKDKQGKRIILFKTDTVDPSKISLSELAKFETLLIESILDEPEIQSTGLCLIVDAQGISMRMMSWLTPSNIKRSIRRLDNIIMKDGVFHIVRSSFLLSAAMRVVMPLLPQVIKDRLKFHYNDFDSLQEHIDPECLPKEFGGELDLNYEALNNEFLQNNIKQEVLYRKFDHIRDIVKTVNTD